MRELFGILAGAALGATAMYYLDPELGRRRRQRLLNAAPWGAGERQDGHRALRADDLHPGTRNAARNDAQLRQQVALRLGQLVSHPGAIHVEVDNAVVRLSGDVLGKELDGLLSQVRDMPGVRRIINALSAHDSPQGISGLQGRLERAGLSQPQAS
jgi:hypothetical protein